MSSLKPPVHLSDSEKVRGPRSVVNKTDIAGAPWGIAGRPGSEGCRIGTTLGTWNAGHLSVVRTQRVDRSWLTWSCSVTKSLGRRLVPLAVMDRNASNNVELTKVDDEFIEHVHGSYPSLTPEDAEFMRKYEGQAGKRVIRKVCSNSESSADATRCMYTSID